MHIYCVSDLYGFCSVCLEVLVSVVHIAAGGLVRVVLAQVSLEVPKGPCTQIVYTLGPMYLYREYFKAKVYTIWVHGPLGRFARPRVSQHACGNGARMLGSLFT